MRTRAVPLFACFAMFLAVAPTAVAQSTGGADLSLDLQGPAETPLVGDVFTLTATVANSGDAAAEGAFLSFYLGDLSLQAAVPSDPSVTCSEEYPYSEPPPGPEPAPDQPSTGGRSAPGFYGGGLYCDLGTSAAGAATDVVLELQRVTARETYLSASVSSATEDTNYEDNWKDLYLEADRSNPADLGLTIDGPKAPAIGERYRYTLTVTNRGPSTATNIRVTDSGGGATLLGTASSDATATCENTYDDPSYGGYFEVVCTLASLEPRASATISLDVERTTAWEVYNSAGVISGNFDDNYDNDYAWHSIAADPSVTSDLALDASGPAETPLVGETFTTTFHLSNLGPSTAGDVWFSDYLTDGLEFVSVEPADRCSYNDFGGYPYADGPEAAPAGKQGDAYYPVSPSGVYCDLGALDPGASIDVSVTATRTKARELWTSAWVSSSNHDPLYDNNYTDLQLEPDKSNPADVSAAMSAPERPDVGSNFDIVMSVTNNGPSQAHDVKLNSFLPWGVDFVAVDSEQCAFVDGGGPQPLAEDSSRVPFWDFREVRCDFGPVAAGETRSATVTVNRTTEYEIWASSWTETANYDPNYENDYASVAIAGEPYPGACPASGESIEGTGRSDTIVAGDCAVETKAGADSVQSAPSSQSDGSTIETGGGPDNATLLLGSTSDDRRRFSLAGGKGNDTLTLTATQAAGNATVFLNGGAGRDHFVVDVAPGVRRLRVFIRGNDGDDTLTVVSKGGPGGIVPGVVVYGGAGKDVLEGGDGNDKLFGGRDADRLFGGMGDDELDGGRGRNSCRGGPGRDTSRRCLGRL